MLTLANKSDHRNWMSVNWLYMHVKIILYLKLDVT